MAAGVYNFTIDQGVTLTKRLTFYTDSTKTTPIDLSSHLIECQLRKEKKSVDKIDDLTSVNGRIDTTDADTGVILLLWSKDESATLDFDSCYYDIKITLGVIAERKLEGTVTLNKQVTR